MRGMDLQRVRDVIVRAFNPDDFDMLLKFKFDRTRRDEVGDAPFKKVVFDILTLAVQEGWEALLIAAVAEERPLKQEVQDLYSDYAKALLGEVKHRAVEQAMWKAYQRFGLSPGVALLRAGTAQRPPSRATDEGPQKTIKQQLNFLDVGLWREQLARMEGRVCRVELNDGTGNMGTGFLVGPDTLLTNYHVLESVLKQPDKAGAVRFRFDYKQLATGAVSDGTLVKLHATDWKLDHSPYSAAEAAGTPDTPPPTAEQLDYALVRLERPVGQEPMTPGVAGSPLRGWIRMPDAAPALTPKMALLILQHPKTRPLKLALDTEALTPVVHQGLRVRYTTNTEGGSSGSPCFNTDWSLVALHHYGDPAYNQPQYNQGIPIGLIRERITAQGKAAALGGDPP